MTTIRRPFPEWTLSANGPSGSRTLGSGARVLRLVRVANMHVANALLRCCAAALLRCCAVALLCCCSLLLLLLGTAAAAFLLLLLRLPL